MLTVPTPYPQPGGGDESKKQWFIRIGNETCGCLYETSGPKALMQADDFTPTPYFWANSTLGKLIPYNSQGLFYDPVSQATQQGYAATDSIKWSQRHQCRLYRAIHLPDELSGYEHN